MKILSQFLFLVSLVSVFVACANRVDGENNQIHNESNINPSFRNDQHNATNKLFDSL